MSSQMFGLEGQAMSYQSLGLLESPTTLTTTVVSTGSGTASDGSNCSNAFVFEDEGDVFQCGRCKRQFSSLSVFMLHKREGCCSNSEELLDSSKVKVEEHHDHEGSQFVLEDGHLMSDLGEMDEPMSGISIPPSVAEPVAAEVEQGLDVAPSSGDDNLIGGQASSVVQSIILTDDTYSFTIPVDHNSQLAQLLAGGTNSQTILHIPDNELAALIAGERIHISASESSTVNSQGLFLTASFLPSNPKEPLSEKNSPADPLNYNVEGQFEAQHLFHLKRDAMLVNTEGGSLPKPKTVQLDESVVVRMAKEKSSNISNRENTHLRLEKPNKTSKNVVVAQSQSSKIASAEEEGSSSETTQKGNDCGEAKRKCEYCGKPFKKLFNLHQHIRSHTGEKPFHCLVCGRGFTQKSNVKKHMQTHKVWPKVKYTLPKEQISIKLKDGEPVAVDQVEGEQSPAENVEYIVNNVYVCQYCDQHFENYHKLKTHLSHTHKNEKLFKCIHKDCMATFMEVEGLITHMKSHEDQIEYQCQNCPKTFKNLYDLGAHQYSHRLQPNKPTSVTPTKQFRCTKCNSKYASAEALNHHLLTSSHNYPCSQCQLTFVCERYLRRHLRIHGTVEPYKCDLCGKMFKTENYLKSHLVIHSDSKPFHCEICKQSFNRRDKLTRHKLMHDNRKKYKCPYKNTGCEREFYRKDKLKDHMMSHSRKVYSCPKCGKNFSWPVRLRKHQATHHPEMLINITCPTCHKIFKTKHHLKIHVCKGSGISIDSDLNVAIAGSSAAQDSPHGEINSGNLIDHDPINKVVVLYNDCEIDDSIHISDEKCGQSIMLGSYAHADDPEAVMFTRYASEIQDKESCPALEGNDDGGIGPMEMTFETGVDGHMDHLITTE